MAEVIKITKPTFNVLTETNLFNFILTSDYPTYKISLEGSANFTMATGQWEAFYTIPHGLSYIPMVFGWVERSGKIYPCNMFTGISDVFYDVGPLDTASVFSYCSADATNVYIGVYNDFPTDAPAIANYQFTAHWKIFLDQQA